MTLFGKKEYNNHRNVDNCKEKGRGVHMAIMSGFTNAVKEFTNINDEAAENVFDVNHDEKSTNSNKSDYVKPMHMSQEKKQNIIKKDIAPSFEGNKITKTMVITGKIESKDSIKIVGKLYGDVVTDANVIVDGIVKGNIKGTDLSITGKVQGNVKGRGTVSVETEAAIMGDISGEYVNIGGKVKGNIKASESTSLFREAWVDGNIETKIIASDAGSRIKGNVLTRNNGETEVNIEKVFSIGD